MNNLTLCKTHITGLQTIKRHPLNDERGYLERMFCQDTLKVLLKEKTIRQINHTLTHKEGLVRGLHFQYGNHKEIKIVSCLKGMVWDVAVDLRKGSPTFLKYHAVILSEDNLQSFFIPEGFAHGFQTLTTDCEMMYFHTADYNDNKEGAINALDPLITIKWPKPITERSERDIGHKMLSKDFLGIEIL